MLLTASNLGRGSALRLLGLAVIATLLLLAAGSAPAEAARQYECQISGLETAPADECNGTGNVVPGGQLHLWGVTVDGSNNIWVVKSYESQVLKFDSSGNYLTLNDGSTAWGTEGLTDLSYSKSANLLYGPQPQTGDAWKIALDASVPGKLVTGEGYVSNFATTAVDNGAGPTAGDLYIGYADGKVARFKADGSPDAFTADQPYLSGNRITGIAGSPDSLTTKDVAIAPNGDIYVMSFSFVTYTPEIQRYDSTGKFIRTYTGAFANSQAAGRMAIDPTSGNMLIHDPYGPGGNTVWELDESGAVVREINGTNANAPENDIGGANGIATDDTGRIYLASENGLRIIEANDPLPKITYGAETGITRTSIDMHATVDPNGAGDIISCKVEFGKTFAFDEGSVPCNPAPAPKFTGPTAIEAHISPVQAEYDYHYRVVVETAAGVRNGDGRSFHLTAIDDVKTGPAKDLGKTTATVTGSFSDDGTPTKYYFEYGNTPALGKRFPALPGGDAPGGGGTVTVSSGLTDLQPGTTYYYRVVFSTVYGTTYGELESFKTLDGPTIESFAAREVNETSADLVGQINPNGFATKYRFDYGPTTDYGQVAPVPDGTLDPLTTVQPVKVHLEGLTSGVTYHFKLTAESDQGTVSTEDQTFTFFPPNCPNAQVRTETGASYLPDCRAYELVSPGAAGGILLAFDAPPVSSATNPSRFAYSGIFGTLRDVGLPSNVRGDLYVAERSSTGWSTKYVGLPSNMALENGGPPTETIGRPVGVLTNPAMSLFMVWNTGTQGYICPCLFGSMAPYILGPRGDIIERLPSNLNAVPGGEDFRGDVVPSSDFSHVFFSATTPAFVEGAQTAAPGSVYDNNRTTGQVDVISTAPGGGPILQDPEGPQDPAEFIRIAAASADGSRVLMSTAAANGRHLYMHEGGQTVDVSLGQDGKNHGVEYNGMTTDGSTVIFSSRDQLTADDHDASQDIFTWKSGGTVTRVSTGTPGSGDTDECPGGNCDATMVAPGTVYGLYGPMQVTDTTFGKSNGEVWFYSYEQLDGNRGLAGSRNLYTVRDGQVQHVATLTSGEPLKRIQASPTNDHVAFLTNSRVTSYDNNGFDQMYSYDVDQRKLKCVSCLPSGAAPTSSVLASFNGLFMSDDGRTFFTSKDSLVDADINGMRDTYEFVDGRPQLISNGLSTREIGLFGYFASGLVGVSNDGVDVYFASYEHLVGQDNNGQFLRFYDARTGGGFPYTPPAPPCAAADECHGPGTTPPNRPEITSGAKLGKGGNVSNGKQKKPKTKCAKKKKCKKGSSKKKKSAKRGAGR